MSAVLFGVKYKNGGLVGLYFGWIMSAPVVYSFMIWNENS